MSLFEYSLLSYSKSVFTDFKFNWFCITLNLIISSVPGNWESRSFWCATYFERMQWTFCILCHKMFGVSDKMYETEFRSSAETSIRIKVVMVINCIIKNLIWPHNIFLCVFFSFLTMTTDPEEQKKLKPLMLTHMYLQIPRVLIKPTLEEIQSSFSQVQKL